ncbi:hypothetical protein DRQ09_07775, partial [candidate division KSB1 bacterium]
IIILTPYYQRLFMPQKPEITRKRVYSDTTITLIDSSALKKRPIATKKASENIKKEEPLSGFNFDNLRKIPEEEVIIETPLYKGVISTKGATIKKWIIKSYLKSDNSPVNLIDNNRRGNLSIAFLTVDDKILNFSDFGFLPVNLEKNDKGYYINVDKEEKKITFVLNIDKEKKVEKEFIFYPDRYDFDLKLKLVNLSDFFGARSYYVIWGSGLSFTEKNPLYEIRYSKAYALMGTEIEKMDAGKNTVEKSKALSGDTRWVAVRNKYFTMAIIPREKYGRGAVLKGVLRKETAVPQRKEYQVSLEMGYNMEPVHTDQFTVYLGPLSYKLIKGFSVKLEKIMDFGWKYLRPLSKLIYHSLVLMYKVIPNYGFVIIVFAILLNIILYPLTMKSYKSMKEMQVLQPKLMELKEKYKGDPQRLNKETMKLYKEYGVNPMGSCLPLLLQMPVFFALYPVFRSTIEFRGAKFIWWIKDLSSPDTVAKLPFSLPMYGNEVNVLPIIWVVTMFISQKMTMKDPKQKFMVYFMPIMMLLFFNRLSSGLVLYWTIFNLLSVLQRYITKSG